ncbi:MAG: mitochondrial fission ELM1 family protein [Proteobacteria bacterium]|nr:mitochondrial fission ELM1 family protein [Pseudomonadota bacterium]
MGKKLLGVADAYPEITFFICPGRRTGNADSYLIRYLKGRAPKMKSRISIVNVKYEHAIKEYNPYLGLLAHADHIVVAGNSCSLVSEALFTGKNIYIYEQRSSYNELRAEKYVSDVLELPDNKPFPTTPMKRLDITRSVAERIAHKYQQKAQTDFRKMTRRNLTQYIETLKRSEPRLVPV